MLSLMLHSPTINNNKQAHFQIRLNATGYYLDWLPTSHRHRSDTTLYVVVAPPVTPPTTSHHRHHHHDPLDGINGWEIFENRRTSPRVALLGLFNYSTAAAFELYIKKKRY